MQVTTVTTKGQFTIPADIRESLGIKPGDKLVSERVNGEIRIKPAPSIFELAGSLKTKKKYNKKKAREEVGKYLAKRYLKTLK